MHTSASEFVILSRPDLIVTNEMPRTPLRPHSCNRSTAEQFTIIPEGESEIFLQRDIKDLIWRHGLQSDGKNEWNWVEVELPLPRHATSSLARCCAASNSQEPSPHRFRRQVPSGGQGALFGVDGVGEGLLTPRGGLHAHPLTRTLAPPPPTSHNACPPSTTPLSRITAAITNCRQSAATLQTVQVPFWLAIS